MYFDLILDLYESCKNKEFLHTTLPNVNIWQNHSIVIKNSN